MSDRTLQFFVPTWDSDTFPAAIDALSEAGFVPEVSWEAMVRHVSRLTGHCDEPGLAMWNGGVEAWFSLQRHGESWLVDLSLKMRWFEKQHDDWRPRFVAIASAFHATTVIVNKGEAIEDVIDVTDDQDLDPPARPGIDRRSVGCGPGTRHNPVSGGRRVSTISQREPTLVQ